MKNGTTAGPLYHIMSCGLIANVILSRKGDFLTPGKSFLLRQQPTPSKQEKPLRYPNSNQINYRAGSF